MRCQFCIVDGSVHRKEVEDAERGARSRPTRWHSMHRKSLRGVLIARYERSPVAVIVLLCRLLLRHHTEFGSPAVCSFVSINSMLSITRLTPRRRVSCSFRPCQKWGGQKCSGRRSEMGRSGRCQGNIVPWSVMARAIQGHCRVPGGKWERQRNHPNKV